MKALRIIVGVIFLAAAAVGICVVMVPVLVIFILAALGLWLFTGDLDAWTIVRQPPTPPPSASIDEVADALRAHDDRLKTEIVDGLRRGRYVQ